MKQIDPCMASLVAFVALSTQGCVKDERTRHEFPECEVGQPAVQCMQRLTTEWYQNDPSVVRLHFAVDYSVNVDWDVYSGDVIVTDRAPIPFLPSTCVRVCTVKSGQIVRSRLYTLKSGPNQITYVTPEDEGQVVGKRLKEEFGDFFIYTPRFGASIDEPELTVGFTVGRKTERVSNFSGVFGAYYIGQSHSDTEVVRFVCSQGTITAVARSRRDVSIGDPRY